MILRELGLMRSLDIVVGVLLVIGGLNWGLVGVFGYNFIDAMFAAVPWVSRIIYALVGLSAFYEVFQWKAMQRRWNCSWAPMEHTTA